MKFGGCLGFSVCPTSFVFKGPNAWLWVVQRTSHAVALADTCIRVRLKLVCRPLSFSFGGIMDAEPFSEDRSRGDYGDYGALTAAAPVAAKAANCCGTEAWPVDCLGLLQKLCHFQLTKFSRSGSWRCNSLGTRRTRSAAPLPQA